MSPRYERDDIDQVRERADIGEVISEHVRLLRAGRQLKGLCPFHDEKTPSFYVNRELGVYHCKGCGEGGNVFHFVQKVDNLTFPEALETLARRFGVELREVQTRGGAKESPRSRLIALHEAAVAHYVEMLESPNGAQCRAYLDERGIDETQRATYRIGFGGWGRENLTRALTRKGFTFTELNNAGLASRDARGVRDTFGGRLVFPIFDASDRPVGFGGRVLPEAYRRDGAPDTPKYLNTRETPIFHKSRVLYGMNWARGHVFAAQRLVIVEGYTDVIAMHEAGIRTAVATCGTSLTKEHMQEISRRFGDVRIILCLDADPAGQAAMSRGSTQELAGAFGPGESVGGAWLPVGRGWLPEVHVALLPQGQDPADFVRAVGPPGIVDILDRSQPLVEFLLRRSLNGIPAGTPEERARAVRKAADVLGDVGDSLLRHEYGLWVADRLGVEPYEVLKVVDERAGGRTERRGAAPATVQPVTLSGSQRVEREALRGLVVHPHLLADASVPAEDDFTLPLHRSVLKLLIAERDETGTIDLARLATRIQDGEVRRTVSEIALGQEPSEKVVREVLRRLQESTCARRIEEIKGQLRRMDPDREAAAYDALFEIMAKLEMRRRELREQED